MPYGINALKQYFRYSEKGGSKNGQVCKNCSRWRTDVPVLVKSREFLFVFVFKYLYLFLCILYLCYTNKLFRFDLYAKNSYLGIQGLGGKVGLTLMTSYSSFLVTVVASSIALILFVSKSATSSDTSRLPFMPSLPQYTEKAGKDTDYINAMLYKQESCHNVRFSLSEVFNGFL